MKRAGKNRVGQAIAFASLIVLGGCLDKTEPVTEVGSNGGTPGLNQSPAAVISATPTSGTAALQVQVDASQSSDDGSIVRYQWNFGDGNSSQVAATSHIYSQVGTYALTLTVTDDQSAVDTASTTIDVRSPLDPSNQSPSAVISATPSSGEVALTVQVDASQSTDDGSIVSYQWNFGDGDSSQAEVTSHIYSQTGSYPLTLTVTDNEGAVGSASTTIQVSDPPDPSNQPPTAVISATPTSGPAALQVQVDASQSTDDGFIVSYQWDFDDDGAIIEAESTSYIYTQAGSYDVTLTVRDDQGDVDSTSTRISVFDADARILSVNNSGSPACSDYTSYQENTPSRP